jgi:hypothetical protein
MIMYDMVYMSIIGKSHLIEVDWHEDEGKIIWYHILCCTHFRHVVSLVEYYDIIVALWVHVTPKKLDENLSALNWLSLKNDFFNDVTPKKLDENLSALNWLSLENDFFNY